MAAGGAQYTVFGFDSRIDWKPTVFVDGIPKNRLCSACGLVSAAIALLPCHHTLCNRCYDSSGDDERNRCPLDTESCKPEDVIWSSLAREKLLGRKIQCWNSSNGCDFTETVSQVVDHFGQDCQYHAVTCFRCSRTMAYKELADHLKSNHCTFPEATTASSSHGIPDATVARFEQGMGELREKLSSLQTCFDETKELIAVQTQVFRERAAADMLVAESVQTFDNTLKESISQNQAATDRISDELALARNSISATTNTLREVVVLVNKTDTSHVSTVCCDVQQRLNDFTVSSAERSLRTEKRLDSLEKIAREHVNHEVDFVDSLKRLNECLTGEVCPKLSVLVNGSKAILQNTLSVSEPLVWTIEKWSELKKDAATMEVAIALAESAKYFYGYSILPGIRIENTDGELTLHLCCHVCRGEYDLLVDWPIKKKLILHVLNAQKTEIPERVVVNTSIGSFKELEMPTSARNDGLWSTQSIKVTDIERNGCVQDDKISVKFTVSQL